MKQLDSNKCKACFQGALVSLSVGHFFANHIYL